MQSLYTKVTVVAVRFDQSFFSDSHCNSTLNYLLKCVAIFYLLNSLQVRGGQLYEVAGNKERQETGSIATAGYDLGPIG